MISIISIFKEAIDLIEKLLNLKEGFNKLNNSKEVTEAIISLRRALDKTSHFIETTGYQANDEVSELWLDVFRSFRNTSDSELTQYAENFILKSQFWRNPEIWVEAGESSLSLIPKLKDLENQLDSLLARTR